MQLSSIDHDHRNQLFRLEPGTKILFANFPADGHFNPLTGLAAHLKRIGCDVRWYTSERYRARVEKLGLAFCPFRRALDFFTDPGGMASPRRARCKTAIGRLNFDIVHAFVLRGAEFYEDMKEIRQDFSFDLVIADICFTGIPFIREKMNLPVVAIGIVPLIKTSKDLPPSGLAMTPDYSFAGRLKQAFLRKLAKKVLFARSDRVMHREFARHGIDMEDEFLFDVLYAKSSLVLQSGCPGFEYWRSDLDEKIKFIGALLPQRTNQTDSKFWFDERLLRYKKSILVTQGTVEPDVNKIIVPTLEAFKHSDVLVIATTGGNGTEDLRRHYPQANLIIEDFIPFAAVMPHVQAYVTNGGFGGVMLGIQHGLPMVVAGVHEGKNEINARIGYFGLGINLKTETPRPVQIRYAVETILSNPSYKQGVKKLREELESYDPAALCEHSIARLLPAKRKASVSEETPDKEPALEE